MAAGQAGGGAVVCGVEALALKHDANRLVYLAQADLMAGRADGEGIIGEVLELIKTMAALGAFVGINRHFFFTSFNFQGIIAYRQAESQAKAGFYTKHIHKRYSQNGLIAPLI